MTGIKTQCHYWKPIYSTYTQNAKKKKRKKKKKKKKKDLNIETKYIQSHQGQDQSLDAFN